MPETPKSFLRPLIVAVYCLATAVAYGQNSDEPNFVVIYTDDHRWDAVGVAPNLGIQTPNIDRLAEQGMYFPNSFVTLSICAPSRAALLTGQYGSSNGVMDMESPLLLEDETLAERLVDAGYDTGLFGKWHLSSTPERLGFRYASYFYGLVPYWDVEFERQGEALTIEGFVDDATTAETIQYLEGRSSEERPFFVCYNSFAPHMDNSFAWPARDSSIELYPKNQLPVPQSWEGKLQGKPPYLERNRPRLRALEYGYADKRKVIDHIQGYYASVTDMDTAIGALLDYLDAEGLRDSTYIFLMGDNGWFNAEHGLTSKVLAYEESIRVPFIVSGPGVESGVCEKFALNVDIMPTILDLAGLEASDELDGASLVPLLEGRSDVEWRDSVYYEAPHSQHGTQPLLSVRTKDWKYIATYADSSLKELIFEELYQISHDASELRNLVGEPAVEDRLSEMRQRLAESKEAYSGQYISPEVFEKAVSVHETPMRH